MVSRSPRGASQPHPASTAGFFYDWPFSCLTHSRSCYFRVPKHCLCHGITRYHPDSGRSAPPSTSPQGSSKPRPRPRRRDTSDIKSATIAFSISSLSPSSSCRHRFPSPTLSLYLTLDLSTRSLPWDAIFEHHTITRTLRYTFSSTSS